MSFLVILIDFCIYIVIFYHFSYPYSSQDKPVPIPTRKDDAKPKPPPDFVRNVVGSSAAAGSAEFHIFRNNKRREQERLAYIEKQAIKDDLDREYEERKRARKENEEQKTAKKRERRQRQKEHKKRAKLDKVTIRF